MINSSRTHPFHVHDVNHLRDGQDWMWMHELDLLLVRDTLTSVERDHVLLRLAPSEPG